MSYQLMRGVAQAKNDAEKMHIDLTYAINGDQIYQVNMRSGSEGLVPSFPIPDVLWKMTFEQENTWRNKFNSIPFEDVF